MYTWTLFFFTSESLGSSFYNPQTATPESTSIACEKSVMKLDCERKNGIIRITRANYGRFTLTKCNSHGATKEWNVSCLLPESKRIVAERLVLFLKGQKLYFSIPNDNHQDLLDKSNNDLSLAFVFYGWLLFF